MSVEPPAKIAILGAGPIGLETALYARFLGYDVDVYERGHVAHHVRQWGHIRMFSPFRMNRSTLGLAALAAQSDKYKPPDSEDLLTGRQWAERYLLPLSETDLLVDAISLRTQVVAVGRESVPQTDGVGETRRAGTGFRILLRNTDGTETSVNSDVVVDTTGVYGNPNRLGADGIWAQGEREVRDRIGYGLPDVLGQDRNHYAGRHTLVVGGGNSAATTVVALCQLADDAPGTQVTWAVRRDDALDSNGPIGRIENDSLPQRDRLAQQANQCVTGNPPRVTLLGGTVVEMIQWDEETDKFTVRFAGLNEAPRLFDRVVSHTGFRRDRSLYRELEVHESDDTEGPINLAAWLRDQIMRNGFDEELAGSETSRVPEPNFYILGSKSYGRDSSFLFAAGLSQIQQLFTVIGDREDLDLYANVVDPFR